MRNISAMFFAIFMILPAAEMQAQEQAWIQVEALQSLSNAQETIRRYRGNLQDVNGFSTPSGWYAIALGPYSPNDALQVLAVYKADRLIPQDSYIAQSSAYQQQFWPEGANALRQSSVLLPQTSAEPEIVVVATTTEPEFTQETKREARASESLLDRDQRKELQVALQWAGFYEGAIDGAYGRGTRGSMSRWQERNNFAVTGVLTTFQRVELLRQFNSVFEGLGLEVMHDRGAGIAMILPTSLVKFADYEPPFVHYNPVGNARAKVLMISQQGDENTLAGLYDIMQTLEIVPLTGPREIEAKAFTLVGEGTDVVSHTQAWLEGDEIKGFTLVWPAGDDERRQRVLTKMLASFERTSGVLDPAAGSNKDQRIDLLAGLQIRQPEMSRSGFYVDQSGAVITSDDILASCTRITIDEDFEAEVAAHDAGLGIVVLRAKEELAPLSVAAFQQLIPRLQSEIAVAGYSYGGILGAPTLTFGQLADLRGLNGEAGMKRLALAPLEGDVGGPVIDAGGAVLGMLLPAGGPGRVLPEGVSFAAGSEALIQVLQQAGITAVTTTDLSRIPPETLTRQASDMTVLVSCWK